MRDDDEITSLQAQLAAHRRTLATLLAQHATFTSAYAPPQLVAGIAEARASIAQCKAALREWGVVVEDHPDAVESPLGAASAGLSALAARNQPAAPTPRTGESQELLAEYRLTPAAASEVRALTLKVLVVGVALSGLGGALILSAPGDAAGFAGMSFLGLLIVAFAIHIRRRSLAILRATRIGIFADRLEYHHEKGFGGLVIDVCRWDDLAAVWWTQIESPQRDRPPRIGYVLLNRTDEAVFISEDFQRRADLEAAIQRHAAPILKQRHLNELWSNNATSFGPSLTIDQQGVWFCGVHIPWDRIEKAECRGDMIWLHRFDQRSSSSTSLFGVLNFFVFTELVNQQVATTR